MNRPVHLARLMVDLDILTLDLERQPPEPDEQLRLDPGWSHALSAVAELDRVLSEVAA